MLWMFLTLGFLPKKFRELELGKTNLAILFSKLSRNGKIIVSHTDNISVNEIAHPEHWEDLVESLLHRKVILDETFPRRFGRYV